MLDGDGLIIFGPLAQQHSTWPVPKQFKVKILGGPPLLWQFRTTMAAVGVYQYPFIRPKVLVLYFVAAMSPKAAQEAIDKLRRQRECDSHV